jgi:hypothetical protein
MNPDWTNYPYSLVTDVGGNLIGRVLLFLATIVLAVFLGSGIAALTGDHIGWFGAVLIYPIMVIGGVADIWGIFVYGAILFFALIFLRCEISLRWLLLPFLLQGIEAYRWCASWTMKG